MSVLNELRGNSFTANDEQALRNVVEMFFCGDDTDEDTPIGKYAHENNE